jgi:hypothetical protein
MSGGRALYFRMSHRRGGRFFLLGNRPQHVARARNMGQVDLGLDLVFAASGAGRLRGGRRFIGPSAKAFAD